jgi:hypothetical protein
MSGGLLSDFKLNEVDLSGFFPPYEWSSINDTVIINSNNTLSKTYTSNTLTKNENNATNYMVLFNLETTDSASFFEIETSIVFNKTNTGFLLNFRFRNLQLFENNRFSFTIYYLVIYPYSVMQSIRTDSFYKNTNTDTDLVDYFPQYLYSQNNVGTGNLIINISLASKDTLRTNYVCFGTLYDPVTTNPNIVDTRILYYNPTRTSSSVEIRFSNPTSYTNMIAETLVLYFPSPIPSNNVTTNYTTLVGSTTYNLINIYPICSTESSANFSNTSFRITFTIPITNTRENTNYFVITSFVYNSGGTSGTYNPYEASRAATYPYIHSKTTTTFVATFTKTTGDNWSGGLRFLVIYY